MTARLSAAVVSAPFMDRCRPSIQAGLLAAIARRHGFGASTLHLNLDLAARIGVADYDKIAAFRGRMLGDWLFSVAAFGAAAPDPDGAMLAELAVDLDGIEVSRLMEIRSDVVPAYLDDMVADEHWSGVAVAGFTSTYQQNNASFALASRLKARWPHLVTIFGGANFDGEMGPEYVRTVDAIDFAVVGEGDTAFPELLQAIAQDTDPGAVAGVARRVGGEVVLTAPAPPLAALDQLPDPTYDEYFERAEHLGLLAGAQRRHIPIPFESARGCWWGQKHHCTFCGLNGSTMTFRSKSPGRVAGELARQSRRHGSFSFGAVDNIIDVGYLDTLLPALRDTGTDYDIFYEIKANLTRPQLKLLAEAGVRRLQPGLESLSSHVLGLMRKGIRAIQNVNTLRWARYYGIDVQWNLIWGFPGELASDYADQAALVPHLTHLQPPGGGGRIWLERFSPLYVERATLGIRAEPEASYRYVYPSTVDLERIAYFFDYELPDPLPTEAYAPLAGAAQSWAQAWRTDGQPFLEARFAPDYLQVTDARHVGREAISTFYDDIAEVYRACMDRPTTAQAVSAVLPSGLPAEAVQEVMIEFEQRGLMLLDGTWALSLALPAVPGR